ncbi:MAG: hypothetical protein AAF587_29295 [Bacteroidota bacterium]
MTQIFIPTKRSRPTDADPDHYWPLGRRKQVPLCFWPGGFGLLVHLLDTNRKREAAGLYTHKIYSLG